MDLIIHLNTYVIKLTQNIYTSLQITQVYPDVNIGASVFTEIMVMYNNTF